jgi:hypothetical protein
MKHWELPTGDVIGGHFPEGMKKGQFSKKLHETFSATACSLLPRLGMRGAGHPVVHAGQWQEASKAPY